MCSCKGLRLMQMRLQKCDCVIEVHDARISFTSDVLWSILWPIGHAFVQFVIIIIIKQIPTQ